MQERRLRERIPLKLDIELLREDGWRRIEHSRNLSMGGVELCSTSPLSLGEKLRLRFCINETSDFPPLEVSGVIVRVAPLEETFCVGVQFENLQSDASIFLYRMIQYHKT
ncbi:MAG TPA: PilZ domain-containing protein [Fibrobacteraceae bacterium]|nr:PilZ domain-containing protein [Fibrobacteraceae bacterium]